MFSVIAFSGKIGSGKSSISGLIAEEFNFNKVSFGDYVRKIAMERGIEHTRINLQDLGESLLANNPTQFCLNVLNQASSDCEFVIVDGIRHKIVLEEIRKIIHPNKLIHVHLQISEEIRIKRIYERQEITPEEVQSIDNHPSEKQVTSVLVKLADKVIDGGKDIKDIITDLSEWLKLRVSQ
jgi:dephospho-CoA kinase